MRGLCGAPVGDTSSPPPCPHSPWWRGFHSSPSPVISGPERRSCHLPQKSLLASLRERYPQVRGQGQGEGSGWLPGALRGWHGLPVSALAHSLVVGLMAPYQFYFYCLSIFFLYNPNRFNCWSAHFAMIAKMPWIFLLFNFWNTCHSHVVQRKKYERAHSEKCPLCAICVPPHFLPGGAFCG